MAFLNTDWKHRWKHRWMTKFPIAKKQKLAASYRALLVHPKRQPARSTAEDIRPLIVRQREPGDPCSREVTLKESRTPTRRSSIAHPAHPEASGLSKSLQKPISAPDLLAVLKADGTIFISHCLR